MGILRIQDMGATIVTPDGSGYCLVMGWCFNIRSQTVTVKTVNNECIGFNWLYIIKLLLTKLANPTYFQIKDSHKNIIVFIEVIKFTLKLVKLGTLKFNRYKSSLVPHYLRESCQYLNQFENVSTLVYEVNE